MKGNRIAGCKVLSGIIKKTDLIHLVREDKIISDIKIKSLKQEKVDTDKVKAKTECGIVLNPQHTFKVGDKLTAYKIKSES